MTPASCARYNHTRILHKHCRAVTEFNFIEALKRLGLADTKNLLSRIISEKKIDVFFISMYGDSFLLGPEFLRTLRQKTKIVLCCWDDDVHFDTHSKHYATSVDAVVTTDYFSLAAYRELGVPAILCFVNLSKDMHPPLGLVRDIDVSFVGNCAKADRKAYLDFLEDNGVKVKRFGFGSTNGFLSDEEMIQVFNRSKINLNFSRLEYVDWIHGPSPASKRAMGHKGRPIEVAMTRSFCLSESYPALTHVFEIGAEIDVFTDRNSLLEKVRHYLANEKQREAVAGRSYLRAMRQYEDDVFFPRLALELNAAFNRPEEVSPLKGEDPDFLERRVNDLVVHGLSRLLHGQLRGTASIVRELIACDPEIRRRGLSGGVRRSLDILRRKYCNPCG